MTYIKMNAEWKEGSDKNEMLHSIYLKMDNICANMSRWAVDTLVGYVFKAFRPSLWNVSDKYCCRG
jgi:hypothetical protein